MNELIIPTKGKLIINSSYNHSILVAIKRYRKVYSTIYINST